MTLSISQQLLPCLWLDIASFFHHQHSKMFTPFLKFPTLISLSLADNFTLKFTKKTEDTKCDIPQLPNYKLANYYLYEISSPYLSCQTVLFLGSKLIPLSILLYPSLLVASRAQIFHQFFGLSFAFSTSPSLGHSPSP